jgi:hypothetical protein
VSLPEDNLDLEPMVMKETSIEENMLFSKLFFTVMCVCKIYTIVGELVLFQLQVTVHY